MINSFYFNNNKSTYLNNYDSKYDTLYIYKLLGKDEIENQKKIFLDYEKKNKLRKSKSLDQKSESVYKKEKDKKLLNNNNNRIPY